MRVACLRENCPGFTCACTAKQLAAEQAKVAEIRRHFSLSCTGGDDHWEIDDEDVNAICAIFEGGHPSTIDKIEAILSDRKYGTDTQWVVANLRALLGYKPILVDTALPARIADFIASLEANGKCKDPEGDELVQSVYLLIARQLKDILNG